MGDRKMPNKLISINRLYPVDGKYFQCEHVEIIGNRRSTYSNQYWERRCGQDAEWLITQEGELSHHVFSKHICTEHAKPYMRAMKEIENES